MNNIEHKEDDSFTAECTIHTEIPKGKLLAEVINTQEIENKHFGIEPQGYYDKQNENLAIVGYSIKID